MFSKLKIGDFARLNNLSVQALRHYEKIGLLYPIDVDTETNYRYYHLNQSAILDNIQLLKQLSFSLADIKKILDETNSQADLDDVIQQKQAELLAEKQKINDQLALLKTYQEGVTIFEQNKFSTNVAIENFASRSILTYAIDRNIYAMTEAEYEYYLREFKLFALKSGLKEWQFNRVGSIMSRQNFTTGEFISTKLFIFVPYQFPHSIRLRKGSYATNYCHSFKEELPTLKHFNHQIEQLGYLPKGDYICEVVYEKTKTKDLERHMFIRMQIPI